MKKLIILCALIALSAGSSLASGIRNFSGTWVVDKTKTKSEAVDTLAKQTTNPVVITQDEKNLVFSLRSMYTLPLDGSKSTSTKGNALVTVYLEEKSDSKAVLNIEARNSASPDSKPVMKTICALDLSADGSTLIMNLTVEREGKPTIEYQYFLTKAK